MISDENQEIIRRIVRNVLREELERWAVKKKPPEDLSDKRRKAAMAMLAKRAAKAAIAEQKRTSKKVNGHAHPRANAEQKFTFPVWLEPHRDVWDAWIAARTKAKHPPTEWALSLAVTKLERMQADGHNVRRLLADAAFHNWQSFYVPKENQ